MPIKVIRLTDKHFPKVILKYSVVETDSYECDTCFNEFSKIEDVICLPEDKHICRPCENAIAFKPKRMQNSK